MKNQAIEKGIRFVVFLLIGGMLCAGFFQVFHFKYGKNMEKYQELPKDSVDVVFVGSSHCYRNINPAVLWEQYGIASYALGSASQRVWNSYYHMEEAVKTQHPKVFVVECYKLKDQEDYADDAVAIKAISGMPLSRTLIENVKASVEDKEEWRDCVLGFPWYHSRYKELGLKDFKSNYNDPLYDNYMGFRPLDKPKKYTVPTGLEAVTERTPMTQKHLTYLDKMCELCDANGIELIFLITPFSTSADTAQMIYNSLADYAADKGIPVINGLLLMEELGFSEEEDFGKDNHLSHSGANKISAYVGEYLHANYALPDHRGDETYEKWEKNWAYLEGADAVKMDQTNKRTEE